MSEIITVPLFNVSKPTEVTNPKPIVGTMVNSVDKINPISNFSKNKVAMEMMMELVKSSITQKPADEKVFQNRNFSDWVNLHNLSVNQALSALVYDGINNSPDLQVPPHILKFLNEQKNYAEKYHAKTEKRLKEFTELTSANGIETVQMKGIGFSMNYPNPTARYGGDIDCINYFRDKDGSISERNASKVVDKLAKQAGLDVEFHGSKHSLIKIKGMPVENHRYFLNEECGPLAKKLNKYLFKVINPQEQILPRGTKVMVPSKEFNTIFISFHALQHFIAGGVNLKHLTDWAVHINKNGLEIPNEIKGTEYEKFIYALTNLSNKYLGTNVNVPKNEELEFNIINKMLGVEPKNKTPIKNPIKVIGFKLNRMKESGVLYNKYFESDSNTMAKCLLKSIKSHIQNPQSLKNILR